MSPFTFPDGTQGNTQDSLYRRTANPEAAASAPPSSEYISSLTIKPEQLVEEKLLQGNEVDAQEESNTGEAAVEYPDELDEFCVGEEDEDLVRRKLFPDNVTAKDEKTGKEKMTPAFERGMKFIEQQMLGNDGWLVPVIKNYASHMEEVDDLSSSPAEAMPATGESELQRNLALAESVKRVSGHWEKEFEKEIESNSHKKLLKKAKGKSKGLKYTAATKPEDKVKYVSIFWFAWSVQLRVHWIVSIIATYFYGVGQVVVFNAVQNYYIDSFSEYAASAIAGGSVFRSLLGGVVPLLAPSLFEKLGYGWGISCFGFVAVVIAPSPLLFYYYGARIRERFQITF
ncbi:hypothetical protein LTR92_001171 [Exophiala xenobiotica]|nr:hypothetical protein LTR92_001171 [Exophiala xenobiotica]